MSDHETIGLIMVKHGINECFNSQIVHMNNISSLAA